MRYGSVCSGIEAATVAWHPLGWTPAFFSEIAPFPSKVLAHRWPSVPNLGDFTTIGAEHGPIDLLVGGTPCQSFSVAGLRGGMGDDRGRLALEFLRLADRLRARWVVWENVPGALSADEGRAFGSVLGGLAELGYGFAYRILDAQFFGVAQRRHRVFVVGYLGDWRPPAAVLFERACLSGDPPPRRAPREEVAGTLGGGSQARGWADDLDRAGAFIPQTAKTLLGKGNDSHADDLETYIPETPHTLRAEGFDASEDGTGRGSPLIGFLANQGSDPACSMPCYEEQSPTLRTHGGSVAIAGSLNAHPFRADPTTEPLVFDEVQITHPENRANPKRGDPAPALSATSRLTAIGFHASQDPISGGGITEPLGQCDSRSLL